MPFCLSHCKNVDFNDSKYFDKCWMKNNETLFNIRDLLQRPPDDKQFIYSEAESIIAGIATAFESIGGTILNFLIIAALLRNMDLRKEYLTPPIISIAIADFLHSIYTLPVMSLHFFTRDMPVTSCQFTGFLGYCVWFCSAWNLLGVSIIRFIAVYFPRKCKKEHFRRYSKILPIIAWIIPVFFFLPNLVGINGQFGLECKTIVCRYINIDSDGNTIKLDLDSMLSPIMMTMGGIMLLLNVATFIQISNERKKLTGHMENPNCEFTQKMLEKERKLGIMMATISILFFLVYCPTFLLHAVDPNAHITKTTASIVCYLMNWSIGILDPVTYIICQKNYRDEIKEILRLIYACENPFKPSSDDLILNPSFHKINIKANGSITLDTIKE